MKNLNLSESDNNEYNKTYRKNDDRIEEYFEHTTHNNNINKLSTNHNYDSSINKNCISSLNDYIVSASSLLYSCVGFPFLLYNKSLFSLIDIFK